jgi:predicted transcriptional regulator
MKPERVLKRLMKFGLTKEEAALYVFLLKSKSATIREIHNSQEYCLKQRSNLYKLLNSLKEKNFVTEEVKSGKKRFFPIAPHIVIANYIKDQEDTLERLRNSAPKLSSTMEDILKTPFEGFSPIPEPLLEFINGVVNEAWSIREPPEIINERKLAATVYSVEFNTHRQFAGSSAGLTLYSFRYETHRDESKDEVQQFQQAQFELALKAYDGQGFFQIETYWVEDNTLDIDGIHFEYQQFHIKSNVSPDSTSGIITLLIAEHPTKIVSLWAAHMEDFTDLVNRFANKFAIIPLAKVIQSKK